MHVIVRNKNSMIGCISDTGTSGKLVGMIMTPSSGMLPGPPGYTPQRGIDYWTPDDQQYIINEVLSSGVVISRNAVALLLTILREAKYVTDQSENIQKLQEELEKGFEEDPDIPDEPDPPEVKKLATPVIRLETVAEPDEPDEPDPPEVKKLATPVIRLETVAEPDIPDEPDEPDEPDIPEGNTPAILGVAILGRTILGDYGGNLPKLTTPVIRLEVVEELPKLTAPVIRLETDTEPDEPDEPDEPEVPVDPDEPDPEPEVPVTPKLEAPVIYLEGCNHTNYTSAITTDATCVTAGEKTFTCTDCSFVWTESIPATGEHEYTSVVTAPTCTEQGYTTHTCTCGDSYKDSYVDALGHNWSEPYYSAEFTTGYGRKCNRCGALDVMMQKLSTPVIGLVDMKLATPVIDIHDYSSTVVEPTCTTQGYTIHSCACGDSYTDTFVDALGHDWGEPYKSGDEYVRDCERCGEQETGAEQYLRGTLSIQVEASGDTSFVSGSALPLTITRPNGLKTQPVLSAASPHMKLINMLLGQYTIAAKAGYGWIDGYELSVKYIVQHGNAEPVETNTFVLTPEERDPVIKVIYHYEKNDGEHVHSYDDTVVTNPKCTTRGYTTHTCICGDTYSDNYVNALGHDWSEPHYVDDEYVRVCNRCGAQRPGSDEDVKGTLTTRIAVDGDRSIDDQGEYRVRITKPNGYGQTPIMGPSWTESKLGNLQLGSYQFEALPEYSWVDGYDLTIKYSVDYVISDPIESQTATLTPDVTNAVVTVTYHYEKNDGEHVHSYTDAVTEPTCTTRGYTTYKCMCGDSYVDNYVNALGHDWSEPGDNGDEYVRVCERCGELPYGTGNLNVSVVVDGDRSIDDQGEYRVQITRPDERNMTAVLNSDIPETRLIDLALGTYQVEALPEYSSADGYNLTIKYSVDYVVSDPIESQTATLTSDVPTVNVTVTYHYEKITEV